MSRSTQEGWPSSKPELTAAKGINSPGVAGNGTKKITGIVTNSQLYPPSLLHREGLILTTTTK